MKSGNKGYWSAAYIRVCMSNMLVFFAFQMLLPTLPVYVAETGGGRSSVGMVVSLLTFAAVLIRLLTGYALDHGNRRAIVTAGSLLFMLSAAAYTLSSSLPWILACSIGLGIGWGILTVAYATLVSDLIPDGRQGAGMGTFMLFAMVSMAAGPYAGGWIYGQFGTGVLFVTAAMITGGSLGLILQGGKKTGLRRESAVPSAGPKPAWAAGMIERTALLPAGLLMVYTFCYGGVLSFAGLFGQDLGIANAGVFFLLSSAAAMAVRPLAGYLFDAKGHGVVIAPGIILGMTSLFLLSTATGPLPFIFASVLYGLSFGAVQPYLLAWTVLRAQPERRGAANSTFLIGMDGGIALGSIGLGFWTEASGYTGMFRGASAILAFLLILYVICLVNAGRQRKSKPAMHPDQVSGH